MGFKTVEVTANNFQSEVLQSATPVLVDFWAEWCGPCKRIAPIVDEIAQEYQGKVVVGKLDADAYPDILMQLGIMSIPTLMLFKNGEMVERITGYKPKEKLVDQLKPHLS